MQFVDVDTAAQPLVADPPVVQRLERGVIHEVHHQVDVDVGTWRDALERRRQLGNADKRHRPADPHVVPAVDALDLHVGLRQPPQQEHEREREADADAWQQSEDDDPGHGDEVDDRLAEGDQPPDVVGIDQADADVDEQARQRAERDHLDPEAQEQDEEQDPDAVEDRRELRLRAGLDVGRRPDDDAGDRQATQQPGQRVGQTLPDEFPIEIGARAGVQLVGGDRTEQRLDAGDGRNGDAAQQHGSPVFGARPRGKLQAAAETALEIDSLDVEAEQHRRARGRGHRDERRGDRRQRARHPLPGQQEGNRRESEEGCGCMQVHHLRRQGEEVLEGLALRRAAEDDVQLREGDGDADAGEHAVHDRR